MWRVRNLLQLLTLYFLWISIIPPQTELFGYNHSLILTYVLGASFVVSIVLSSRSHEVGDHINRGDLSTFLMRPINYFMFWFARDMGDKALNILFSFTELTLFFLILRPPIFIQTEPLYIISFFLALFLALILYFLINLLIGFLGFWSPETWAPRFILFILINFFAGSLFPLDILPKGIFTVFQLSPFPYLLYFPVKIYLGQQTLQGLFFGFLMASLWIVGIYFILKSVWIRGLRIYTAYGR